jgi:hypothetical protein
MLRTVLCSLSFTCSGKAWDKTGAYLVPDVPSGSRHPPSVKTLHPLSTVLHMRHHGKLAGVNSVTGATFPLLHFSAVYAMRSTFSKMRSA